MKRWWMLLAATPLFGFTDCNYFTTVTVPAQDSNPPIVGTRMWIDGNERIDLGSSSHPSTSGSVVVVPFVYDGGGARTLAFGQGVTVHCHNAEEHLGQVIFIDFVGQSTSQTGSVGSSVSDGMYLIGDVTDLSAFASECSAGFQVESVEYGWSVTGTDFAGSSGSTGHSIVWTPSSSLMAAETSSAVEETSSASREALAHAPRIDPSSLELENAAPSSVSTEIYPLE